MSCKIFTLSPGSTSTKLAVFEDEKRLFKASVTHDPEVLRTFATVLDQLPYRIQTIQEEMDKAGMSLAEMDAFAAYSGGLAPTETGIYPVNDQMLADCRNIRLFAHPAMLGAQIIHQFAQTYGKPALVIDPPDSDEFEPLARISGVKGVYRASGVHVLNQKEAGRRAAKTLGKPYADCNLVVCHVGGGLSITAQKHGRIVDANNVLLGDGPMAPNRSGSVPVMPIIRMCYSGKYSQPEMENQISKTGGWLGLTGTDSAIELEKRIADGDKWAELCFDAMAYQLGKYIGSYACVMEGQVDAVVLTGGVSNSARFVEQVEKYVRWIAPVVVFGGDFEMEALASGAVRYLTGEEAPKTYTGVPVWSGFDFEH